MSKHRDLTQLLKQNGFVLVRFTKHAQYSDGLTRITMPTGGGFNERLAKMIKLQIKKAVALRESKGLA